jgi:hypothetical protein
LAIWTVRTGAGVGTVLTTVGGGMGVQRMHEPASGGGTSMSNSPQAVYIGFGCLCRLKSRSHSEGFFRGQQLPGGHVGQPQLTQLQLGFDGQLFTGW